MTWRRPSLEQVKTVVELVGVVAAVVGIGFLVVQTHELRTQNEAVAETLAQTYRQDAFDKSLGFDEFVVEHAYDYEMVTAASGTPTAEAFGAYVADPARKAKADAVAIHILDFYDYVLLGYPPEDFPALGEAARDADPADAEGFRAWSDAIRTAFRQGSHLCRTFADRSESYGRTTFVDRIERAGLCR